MIRYSYNRQFAPPAPLVHVLLRTPDGARQSGEMPAQVDTAADRTVVPWAVIGDLGLVQLDEITVMGIGGSLLSMPTFLVQVEVREFQPLMIEVAASQGERLVLLGRDVLNQYRVLLDGPQQRLEIG